MKQSGNRSLKFAILLITGILLSWMLTAMYLTESISLQCFYDVGNIYDIAQLYYRQPGFQWVYDDEEKIIRTEGNDASCYFHVNSSQKNWNYLYLTIRDLDRESQWQFEFRDQDGKMLFTKSLTVQNGRNILRLEEGEIYAVNIIVKEPSSFAIRRIQFRERMQNFEWTQVPWIFIRVLISYALAVFIIYGFVLYYNRKKPYISRKRVWVETVQKMYASILEHIGQLFGGISQAAKSGLRKLLFLILLLTPYITLITFNNTPIIVRREILLLTVCLLLISILCWGRGRQRVDWTNPLVYSWMILWMMVLVSDFVMGRTIQSASILMMGAMAFLYMAWNSMKRTERLTRDLLAALRYLYWAGSIYCLFFRPYEPGYRYTGIYGNSNLFAGYLVTVNIAFLANLSENLGKEKLKKRVLAENVLGLVTIWGFLQMTESVTSLVAYVAEWTVFVWGQFPVEKRKSYQRNLKRVVAMSLICIVIVGISGKWCLSNIPRVWEVQLEEQERQPLTGQNSLSLVTEAAGQNAAASGLSERLRYKITSGEWFDLFAGRDEIWRNYIRSWNLFGHYGNLESLDGKTMHAHNALLQMMNDYGIFIAVPFLCMLYYSLKYGIKAVFVKKKFGLFFLLAAVNYIVQGLAENTPYLSYSWLVYYIALGGLFSQPEEANV